MATAFNYFTDANLHPQQNLSRVAKREILASAAMFPSLVRPIDVLEIEI